MIKLYSRHNAPLGEITFKNPIIAAITSNKELPIKARANMILLIEEELDSIPEGFLLVISKVPLVISDGNKDNALVLDKELAYLGEKDVVKFIPSDYSIQVLYRFKANTNSILLTERCNSFCLMCSQPPEISMMAILWERFYKPFH